MKYQIRIHGIFESAHFLRNYYPTGENEILHGHTFEAEVYIQSNTLINGISVDFLDVQKVFNKEMSTLDHICLNDLEYFQKENPTAENLGMYLFQQLKNFIPEKSQISEIKIWEGPNNNASFFPYIKE